VPSYYLGPSTSGNIINVQEMDEIVEDEETDNQIIW
jgi:hypothetical protein